MVGYELMQQLRSDDPRERLAAVDRALKFLKDNNITSTVEASVPLQDIRAAMPTAEELEKLMSLTPD
jgi:Fe2+ or Zn2+ uptake regulation protein